MGCGSSSHRKPSPKAAVVETDDAVSSAAPTGEHMSTMAVGDGAEEWSNRPSRGVSDAPGSQRLLQAALHSDALHQNSLVAGSDGSTTSALRSRGLSEPKERESEASKPDTDRTGASGAGDRQRSHKISKPGRRPPQRSVMNAPAFQQYQPGDTESRVVLTEASRRLRKLHEESLASLEEVPGSEASADPEGGAQSGAKPDSPVLLPLVRREQIEFSEDGTPPEIAFSKERQSKKAAKEPAKPEPAPEKADDGPDAPVEVAKPEADPAADKAAAPAQEAPNDASAKSVPAPPVVVAPAHEEEGQARDEPAKRRPDNIDVDDVSNERSLTAPPASTAARSTENLLLEPRSPTQHKLNTTMASAGLPDLVLDSQDEGNA